MTQGFFFFLKFLKDCNFGVSIVQINKKAIKSFEVYMIHQNLKQFFSSENYISSSTFWYMDGPNSK